MCFYTTQCVQAKISEFGSLLSITIQQCLFTPGNRNGLYPQALYSGSADKKLLEC